MDVSVSLVVGGGSRSGVVSACHVAGRGWCCGYLAAVIVIHVQLGVCGVLEEYDAETRASKCNTLVVEYRI